MDYFPKLVSIRDTSDHSEFRAEGHRLVRRLDFYFLLGGVIRENDVSHGRELKWRDMFVPDRWKPIHLLQLISRTLAQGVSFSVPLLRQVTCVINIVLEIPRGHYLRMNGRRRPVVFEHDFSIYGEHRTQYLNRTFNCGFTENSDPRTLLLSKLPLNICVRLVSCLQLSPQRFQRAKGETSQDHSSDDSEDFQSGSDFLTLILYGTLSLFGFIVFGYFYWQANYSVKVSLGVSLSIAGIGLLIGGYGFCKMIQCTLDLSEPSGDRCGQVSHTDNTVPRKFLLTSVNYWDTVIRIEDMRMANILAAEKQVTVISALAEGSGIRQIERMTGVNRNTIMSLGVRVGKGCAALLDSKMRDLECSHLQMDELWGFIGKKQKHVTPEDNPELGDVWTFCAIDQETKLVPSFKVGKRDADTANAFMNDLASRLKVRTQLSADALPAYIEAVEQAFGANVDFAQVIKVFENQSADAEVIRTDKIRRSGRPDLGLASTSHIERLNGTTRLHMRRLTRLTYAFSKKRENFEAAVALHFAYYNFVKRHNSLRCTPAMAAGIEREFWTVKDLLGAAA